jgi:hypothetical protein
MSRKAEKKQNKQSEKVYGEKHRRKWKTKKRERSHVKSLLEPSKTASLIAGHKDLDGEIRLIPWSVIHGTFEECRHPCSYPHCNHLCVHTYTSLSLQTF